MQTVLIKRHRQKRATSRIITASCVFFKSIHTMLHAAYSRNKIVYLKVTHKTVLKITYTCFCFVCDKRYYNVIKGTVIKGKNENFIYGIR